LFFEFVGILVAKNIWKLNMEWLGTFGREIKRLQVSKLSLFLMQVLFAFKSL